MLSKVEDTLDEVCSKEEMIKLDNNYGKIGAAVYDVFYSGLDRWYPQETSILDEAINYYDSSNVLSLACGTGKMLKFVDHEEPSVRSLLGIDSHNEMLRIARERNRAKVRFLKSDFRNLGLKEDEKFDLVYMLGNPINHYNVDVINDILKEVDKILDGYFVYDFLPDEKWEEVDININQVEEGKYEISRATYNKSETLESDSHKGNIYSVYRIENVQNGQSNKVKMTTRDLYSHKTYKHIEYLEENDFVVDSIKKYHKDRKVIHCRSR